jgi:DNA-binding response OmpR family regulator
MPKANPTAPSAEATAARRTPSGPSGILVIDDEALICGLVHDALVARGYTVWQAPSAKRALELLNAQGPKIGLILLDVVMPGTDGLTFLGTLRRLPLNAEIVLMSGRLDADTRWVASESGCRYLCKPFERDELFRLVHEVVGSPPSPAIG